MTRTDNSPANTAAGVQTPHLPIFLGLAGADALVVGGSGPTLARVRALMRAGASVTVIAENPESELSDLASTGRIALLRRAFAKADAAGRAIIFATTDDEALGGKVRDAARERNILVNVHDRADFSSFLVPAVVERGDIVVAIGSGGASPALTRRLKSRLEAILPARLGDLAKLLGSFRASVRSLIVDPGQRHRFWERAVDGPAAQAALDGRFGEARRSLMALIDRVRTERPEPGMVSFIAITSEDPDLLTVRAVRALEGADIVLHDEAVAEVIFDRIRKGARRINLDRFAGKGLDNGASSISHRLIAAAEGGKRVVRLSVDTMGDHDLSGVADRVAGAGIGVEIIPGVSIPRGSGARVVPSLLPYREASHAT